MGYASQSKLCDPMVETFAAYLRDGETIIHSYFKAGYEGEARCTNDHHIQKIVYIVQATNETIYSPKIDYMNDISDVRIIVHDIQEEYE